MDGEGTSKMGKKCFLKEIFNDSKKSDSFEICALIFFPNGSVLALKLLITDMISFIKVFRTQQKALECL